MGEMEIVDRLCDLSERLLEIVRAQAQYIENRLEVDRAEMSYSRELAEAERELDRLRAGTGEPKEGGRS